jgi:peptidoglycan-associated lipoprotein
MNGEMFWPDDWRAELFKFILAAILVAVALLIFSGCSTIRSTCCWWTVGSPPEITVDEPRAAAADRPALPGDATPGVTVTEVEPDMVTIHFDFDQATLRPASIEYLRTLGSWLRRAPSVRIKIEGHTCDIGEAEYNIALGERRARIARQFLIDLGVAASRIEFVSFGEEQPAGIDKWRNRRDDFFIIER